MADENQVIVPTSFVGLYVLPGQPKPTASREAMAARHEVCEDLAQMLMEPARTVLWRHGVTEQDVLDRMRLVLVAAEVGLSADEAQWVLSRLAELLEWKNVTA